MIWPGSSGASGKGPRSQRLNPRVPETPGKTGVNDPRGYGPSRTEFRTARASTGQQAASFCVP